jgi:Fe-S oxidoreductase
MKDGLRRCFTSQCDFCREGCASYQGFKLDSHGPRGKNRILEAYQDGRLSLSELMDLAFKCTDCGQCSEVCITGDGIHNLIRDLRAELVEQSFIPKKLAGLPKRIMEKGTPFDKKSMEWAEARKKKGPVGYFPGCSLISFNPNLASKTLDVLEKFGTKAVPIESQCCSSPLLRTGFVEEAHRVSELLQEEIKEKKIKTLICSCPGCALTFKKEYPALVKGWKVRVLHISEFMEGKSLKNVKGAGKAMYHDPCHLARGLGVTSEPRNILNSLGYEILEFERSGREGICCGGGGGVAYLYPRESKAVAKLKIEEALEAGAELLVTSCPQCENVLSKAAQGKIEVCDILNLL